MQLSWGRPNDIIVSVSIAGLVGETVRLSIGLSTLKYVLRFSYRLVNSLPLMSEVMREVENVF